MHLIIFFFFFFFFGIRLSAPDAIQSVQHALQDAGAVQTAQEDRRQGGGRLHADPAVVPGQHAAAAQRFQRQHQLVSGQTSHLPQVITLFLRVIN